MTENQPTVDMMVATRVQEAIEELQAHLEPISDAHRHDNGNVLLAIELLMPILKMDIR